METNVIEILNIVIENQSLNNSCNVMIIMLLSFLSGLVLLLPLTLKYDWFKND